MHIQVVNFRLNGITRASYETLCDEVAPAFASIPGLISKVWLADDQTGTYGGVYTWRDRAAMEAFLKTNLFRQVATDPNLADITSRDFATLERPSAVTAADRLVAAA
jgi:hypothetical protein